MDQIRHAFERTWDAIQEEKYSLRERRWILKSHDSAVCVYTFISDGVQNGARSHFEGRGTTVLKRIAEEWKIVHEHLSIPTI